MVVRGVDSTSVLDRIEGGLLRGRMPKATAQGPRDVLIGEPLARAFDVDTGDKVTLYLVLGKEDIRPRPMTVAGIYQTGLQEFDQRQVWISAAQMQDAAARGAEAQIVFSDNDAGQPTRAMGQVFGRDPRGLGWRGRWAQSGHGRRSLSLQDASRQDTHVWIAGTGALADTARLWWAEGQWQTSVSSGSHRQVADGYDVWTTSLADVPEVQESLFRTIPYDWSATRVDQQHPEMFSWLRMLDLNVEVIVGLMVLISIVNMTSALLIIMLERRAQVGVWKALGMTDQAVVKTFMWHATRILGQGFAVGNVLALTLVAIQSTWQCVPRRSRSLLRGRRPRLARCTAHCGHGIGGLWAVRGGHAPARALERTHPSLTNFAHVMSQAPLGVSPPKLNALTSTPRGIFSPSLPSMWTPCARPATDATSSQ